MARTISEIYDEIVSVKNGTSELDGLLPLNESSQTFLDAQSSGSKVALWRLWCWIFATVCWLQEVMLDKHKEEVALKMSHTPYGTIPWYHKIVLAFQLGYELEWNEERNQYLYSDTSSPAAVESRIIKRAAVTFANGQLVFKVAKITAGVPAALDNAELSSVHAYLTEMAYPGTNIVLISEMADDLRLDVTFYFDPLVLNPDGSSITDSSVYPVNDAVNAFIQSLPFNGRMTLQKLVDAMQAVPGISDLVLNAAEYRYGNLDYLPTGREYLPFAGHMVLDSANSNFNYTPYV